jgi:hypothetical protein
MRCSLCEKNAEFVCKFCGRIICGDHRHIKPYITAAYDEDNDDPQMISVPDAAWCAKCHPSSQTIKVPELE